MQTKEKSVQKQIQFWALVGPFVSILTLLVSLMKSSPMQYSFAVAMLICVPLCWRFKLKGLAVSLGLLMGVYAYHFADLNFDQRLWAGGVACAGGLAFAITSLSFEEVSSLVGSLQVESKSRLENLLSLDEKLKQSSLSHTQERNQLQKIVEDLERKVEEQRELADSNVKLAQVVRGELADVHSQRDSLQQELFDWRHKHSRLERKVLELQDELQKKPAEGEASTAFVAELDAAKQEITQLKEKVAEAEERHAQLRHQLDYSEEERRTSEALLEEEIARHAKIQEEVEQFRGLWEKAQEEKERLRGEAAAAVAALEEFKDAEQSIRADAKEFEAAYAAKEAEVNEASCVIEKLKTELAEREEELVVEKQRREEVKANAEDKILVLNKLIEEGNTAKKQLEEQLKEATEALENATPPAAAFSEEQYEALRRERDELLAVVESPPSKKESAVLRKERGKYKQLQQQFEEKSKILDDTRRSLFHMQENILNLKREYEESRKSERSENEKMLEKHIEKMEKEREQLDREHQQEIDDLHEIIASLSSTSKN